MRELPEGWASVPLAECGTWLSGGTPSTDNPNYWGGDIPWISAASLKDFYIRDSERRITSLGATAGTRMTPKGSVLFVVRGMSLKTEFRVGVAQRELSFGQDCKAIIPRQGIDGTFLGLALKARSNKILGMVDEAGHGTGRLPTDLLSRLTINIPPLEDQKRIIDIISSIDAEISITQDIIGKLKKITEARTRDLVVALRKGTLKTVGEMFEIKSGITLDQGRRPKGKGHGYLRVANVQRGWIDTSNIAKLEASEKDKNTYGLKSGDLLIVEGHANPQEIGRCARVQAKDAGLVYQNHLFRLRSAEVEPEFAEIWLNSEEAQRYWSRMCGTSSGLYTINRKMLTEMPFPLIKEYSRLQMIDSQKKIFARMDSEHKNVIKLHSLREAITDVLLTGRSQISIRK